MRGSGWLLLLGLCVCGKSTPPTQTPPPNNSRPATKPAPRCEAMAPMGPRESLPFGFYSLPTDRFAEAARAGVTMVGPYYGTPPGTALFDAAVSEGLQVIHAIGLPSATLDETGLVELHSQIDAVVDHEALAAWYVLPEELRPWSVREMAYADAVRSALAKRDPGRRPLLSYQPNHRRRAELADASAALDVVSRGLYANFVGADTHRAWVRDGIRTIATAATTEQTPWAVLEMFSQPTETLAGPERIRAAVRHDVYASMIGGARGVLVFSGWPRAEFPAYADYLAAYFAVATELNGELALATPLLRGDPDDGITTEWAAGPRLVDASITAVPHMLPSVATRGVQYGGVHWLYAVNSAEAAVTLRIASACGVHTVLGPRIADEQVRLPPLGVVVLRAPELWVTDNLHAGPSEEPRVAPTGVGSADAPKP